MLQLDFGDHRPLYEQICDKLKELIISGALGENERIPSVRELAAMLAINPNTIQKAYKELEAEGFIYSQRARGSFVSPAERIKKHTDEKQLLGALEQELSKLYYLGVKKGSIIKLMDKIYEGGEKE